MSIYSNIDYLDTVFVRCDAQIRTLMLYLCEAAYSCAMSFSQNSNDYNILELATHGRLIGPDSLLRYSSGCSYISANVRMMQKNGQVLPYVLI